MDAQSITLNGTGCKVFTNTVHGNVLRKIGSLFTNSSYIFHSV